MNLSEVAFAQVGQPVTFTYNPDLRVQPIRTSLFKRDPTMTLLPRWWTKVCNTLISEQQELYNDSYMYPQLTPELLQGAYVSYTTKTEPRGRYGEFQNSVEMVFPALPALRFNHSALNNTKYGGGRDIINWAIGEVAEMVHGPKSMSIENSKVQYAMTRTGLAGSNVALNLVVTEDGLLAQRTGWGRNPAWFNVVNQELKDYFTSTGYSVRLDTNRSRVTNPYSLLKFRHNIKGYLIHPSGKVIDRCDIVASSNLSAHTQLIRWFGRSRAS